MKGIIILGVILSCQSFIVHGNLQSKEFLAEHVAMKITKHLIHKVNEEIHKGQPFGHEILVTVIPPVDDPATLNPIDIPDVNLQIPDLFNISGSLGFGAACVSGLSKITDDFQLTGLGQVRATYVMTLPTVSIDTTYNADLILDLVSKHSVEGSGSLAASVDNVFFGFNATGVLPVITSRPISLTTLDVDLGFSNLKLSADNATIDGDTIIDWQQTATNIETYFHTIWNDEVRGIVNGIVRCSIDHIVNECSIDDLTSQNFACLKLELTPLCFPNGLMQRKLVQLPISFMKAGVCSIDGTTGASEGTTTKNPPDETTTPKTGASVKVLAPGLTLISVLLLLAM